MDHKEKACYLIKVIDHQRDFKAIKVELYDDLHDSIQLRKPVIKDEVIKFCQDTGEQIKQQGVSDLKDVALLVAMNKVKGMSCPEVSDIEQKKITFSSCIEKLLTDRQ